MSRPNPIQILVFEILFSLSLIFLLLLLNKNIENYKQALMAFSFRERYNSVRRPESGNISETESTETEHADLVSIAVEKSHH